MAVTPNPSDSESASLALPDELPDTHPPYLGSFLAGGANDLHTRPEATKADLMARLSLRRFPIILPGAY